MNIDNKLSSFISSTVHSMNPFKDKSSVEVTKDTVEFSKPEQADREYTWLSAELAKSGQKEMWNENLCDVAKEEGTDRTDVMVRVGHSYVESILQNSTNPYEVSMTKLALKTPQCSHPNRGKEDRILAWYEAFNTTLSILSSTPQGTMSHALAVAGEKIMPALDRYEDDHSGSLKAGKQC